MIGGMQDFNYLFSNAMEVTVEVSCCKYPHRSALLDEWGNNLESVLSFIELSHLGIKGVVEAQAGTREAARGPFPVRGAKVIVQRVPQTQGRVLDSPPAVLPESLMERFFSTNLDGYVLDDSVVTTDEKGRYWKLLMPGTYLVQAVVTVDQPPEQFPAVRPILYSEVKQVTTLPGSGPGGHGSNPPEAQRLDFKILKRNQ